MAEAAVVKVKVTGVESGDRAALSVASSGYLSTIDVTADGEYQFADVPEGRHSVKAEIPGYNIPEALPVIVNADGSVIPREPLRVALTKQSANPDEWNFSWKEDDSPAGYTTTSYVNKPVEIEFLGKKIVPSDVPSAGILENTYHIVLADDGETWTQEYAYRLVETLKTLPVDNYSALKFARFTLTAGHIADDIAVTPAEDGFEVRISKDAFYYANPFLVNLDGVRGRLFSKRLHHAMTCYLTDFGRDSHRVDFILRERFGCQIRDIDYEELTRGITNEDAGRFQEFVPSELVSIINMFEELPEGFHKIPNLKYLIRRINGMPHPLYGNAAAVSWPVENGYIEFMESAFGGNNQAFDTLRLILHEKTHFLWASVFSDQIKQDWIELGGWYEVPGPEPGAPNSWATTKDVEFVSAYAHAISPDEDMAESVAFYLKDPEKLRSRALGKYEFIRDRIMHGTRYISKIPDHLTFEVLNLNPDYDYPGKIKSVDITVAGAPDQDKVVTMEISLNDLDGFDDGAVQAYVRLTSPGFKATDGGLREQIADMYMYPVDGDEHRLRGSIDISRYSKAGHWIAGDIILTDLQGNQRFEGRNDCVTDFYVNNSLEDLEAPKYNGNLRYILTDTIVEGHKAQNLQIRYAASDNIGIESVYCNLKRADSEYSYQAYGEYDPEAQEAFVNILVTEFFPMGDYWVETVIFTDVAHTVTQVIFSDSPLDLPVQKIHITTANPDLTPVEVDLDRITVYAEPTHPEAPDGETLVTINFYARDDKSGFGACGYCLRDPQGIDHFNHFHHRNSSTLFFDGDPAAWERYTIRCVLPQGSAPGIWGLSELSPQDKAGNVRIYNFVETLIFEPDDSESDYVLFSELGADNILDIDLRGNSGETFGFTWRVIHEESGAELSGDGSGQASAPARGRGLKLADNHSASIDVSSLADGDLILIVKFTDAAGKALSVKTSRIHKGDPASVDEFLADPSETPVEVYNLQGLLLKEARSGAWSTGLPSGIYIIRQGTRVTKALLR